MAKPVATLTDWEIKHHSDNHFVLIGKVWSNPRFTDGTVVHTSMLEYIDFEVMQAETKNTIYNLH